MYYGLSSGLEPNIPAFYYTNSAIERGYYRFWMSTTDVLI